MKVASLTLFLAGMLGSTGAAAEGGCPPGQMPQSGNGWQSCVPFGGSSGGSSAARIPREVWKDRYGALVTDSIAGVLGASSNQATAELAVADAMNKCRRAGGTMCVLQGSYANRCLAMAVGPKVFLIREGKTKTITEADALVDCLKENSTCEIFHSSCSYAERVR